MWLRLTVLFAISCLASILSQAGVLDGGENDPELKDPEVWFGKRMGREHIPYGELTQYVEYLCDASDRLVLETSGRTHEGRPMIWVTASSPKNLGQRAAIRGRRLSRYEQFKAVEDAEDPVVVMLAYSIHGNESSGAYASLWILWHLATTLDPEWIGWLDRTIALVQPCQNPDGFDRFVAWSRTRSGKSVASDPWHWEHREDWPGGRGNHYWFDLNRDWLPAQHPETLSRLKLFHQWLPDVVADFHEMGSDSTYFFQPGVPTRNHPLTPEKNQVITRKFAEWHARVLDSENQLYFTEERFDDFYYGKGSTYPDILGSIGILFEQGSVRGRAVETPLGDLDLARTVRNQYLTSLSTLRAADEHRVELKSYHRDFTRASLEEAELDSRRAIVFGDEKDSHKNLEFARLLRLHGIQVHGLSKPVESQDGSVVFRPGMAFVVPMRQMRCRLIQSLWETRKEFEDPVFYDISTWTLPSAWGMPWTYLDSDPESFPAEGDSEGVEARLVVDSEKPAVAHAVLWEDSSTAPLLNQLLESGVLTRVATEPFKAQTPVGLRSFPAGTLVIPARQPGLNRERMHRRLSRIFRGHPGLVHPLTSGLTPEGIDLGSEGMITLEKVRPALVVGRGISAYEAGEVWHHLDTRLGMNPTLLSNEYLESAPLEKYTHILLVNGDYKLLSKSFGASLKDWVARGGVLIAQKSATTWVLEQGLFPHAESILKPDKEESIDSVPERQPYGAYQQDRGSRLISGCILSVDVDLTHPLAFGYDRSTMHVFRNSRIFLSHGRNPYATVLRYHEAQPISGYLPEDALPELQNGASLLADKIGRGSVVLFVDVPCFRGYWFGTFRLMNNALYFGKVIRPTGPLDAE